jgi:hypothetical protein
MQNHLHFSFILEIIYIEKLFILEIFLDGKIS